MAGSKIWIILKGDKVRADPNSLGVLPCKLRHCIPGKLQPGGGESEAPSLCALTLAVRAGVCGYTAGVRRLCQHGSRGTDHPPASNRLLSEIHEIRPRCQPATALNPHRLQPWLCAVPRQRALPHMPVHVRQPPVGGAVAGGEGGAGGRRASTSQAGAVLAAGNPVGSWRVTGPGRSASGGSVSRRAC